MVPRAVLAVLAVLAVALYIRPGGDETPVPGGDGARLTSAADLRLPRVTAAQPPPTRPTTDGFLMVDRTRATVGREGTPVTYTVEVEPALRSEVAALQEQVEATLDDERRGWAHQQPLRQVADPNLARIRVLLATPATVDALCAQAGYYTGGMLSCWNGRFAALNVTRWRQGASGFTSIAQYRTYQINHEFGHGLGRLHEYCPGPGALAPVMMQQTKGLLGCRPNEWPSP